MSEERSDPGGEGGFLPPEPAGRAPQLGSPPPPPPPPQQPQPHQGWQPPAQSWQPSPQQWQQPQQQWGYPPPQVPDNGSAVAGFSLSVSAGALLLVSFGLSSLISLVCAGLGVLYSRRGRARVDRGETPKHRGLAQAGFVIGIVSLVLSVLATAVWTIFVIAYATDDGFRRDFNDENDFNGIDAVLRVSAAVGRSAWSLIA